jgi:drug/metabolite transporter (DMT)-like permease
LGVIFIVVLPLFQKGIKTGDLTGNLLVLIATFMWAIYGILSKRIIEKGFSPISVATVSFIISTILFLIISPFVAKSNFIIPLFNITNLFLLLILGGFATVGSYLLIQWAIKYTSATIASLNHYLQPIFVIVLAALILGEKVTIEFLMGAVLVFAGVFIATYTGEK